LARLSDVLANFRQKLSFLEKTKFVLAVFAAAAVYFSTFFFHYEKINVYYVFNVVLTLLWLVFSKFFGNLRAL